jgi:hypothetical protein
VAAVVQWLQWCRVAAALQWTGWTVMAMLAKLNTILDVESNPRCVFTVFASPKVEDGK